MEYEAVVVSLAVRGDIPRENRRAQRADEHLEKYVSDEGLLAKLKCQQAELSELSESGERKPH
jgi:hypothetical protein